MTERPDDFADELKQAVRNLSSPEPSDTLLARILESRAKGHRVGLPGASRRRRLPAVIGIAAAAAAAVVLWIAVGPRHGSSESQAEAATNSALEEFAAGMGLWPDQLYAQGATSAQLPPIPPRDGSLLKSGRWVYSVQTLDENGKVTAEHPTSISIAQGAYQDQPAWVLVRQRNTFNPASLVDSLWLSRDSLHPLARFSPLAYGSSLRATFTGDSVKRVWLKADGQVEHLSAALPSPRLWDGAVVMSPNELGPLFLTTRLDSSWQGSFAGTAINNGGELVTLWWDLKVVSQERITVPAGVFECWKVALLFGQDLSFAYWVDKDSGWIIQEGAVTSGSYRRVLVSHAAD